MNEDAVVQKQRAEQMIQKNIAYLDKKVFPTASDIEEVEAFHKQRKQIDGNVGAEQLKLINTIMDAIESVGWAIKILSNKKISAVEIDAYLNNKYKLYDLPEVLDFLLAVSAKVLFLVTDEFEDLKEIIKHIEKILVIGFDIFETEQEQKYALLQEQLNEFDVNNEKEKEELEFIQTILPTMYMIPTHKLAGELPKNMLNQGEIQLRLGKNVITYNEFSSELECNKSNMELSNPDEYTAYDVVVQDAIISLYVAGNECFTPEAVYRTMTGATGNYYTQNISKDTVDKVVESIEKMRRIRLTIDFSQEVEERNINIESCKMDDMLLSLKRVQMKTSGKLGGATIIAYRFNSAPILYDYIHKVSNQIATVPIQRLQTKKKVRNTDEVIKIREYLIKRIELLKNKNNSISNPHITYDRIFKECQIKISSNMQRTRYRDQIFKILNVFIEQSYIKEYQEYKSGKRKAGVRIDY